MELADVPLDVPYRNLITDNHVHTAHVHMLPVHAAQYPILKKLESRPSERPKKVSIL